MSNYRAGIRIVLGIIIALLVGATLGIFMERSAIRTDFIRIERGDKMSWALSLINKKYVDHITRDSLAEFAIPAILKELDPHSVYIPAREFAETNEPLAGSFDGIGVMFNMMSDTVQITNVIAGGPSERAGLVPGDRIITVNDSIVSGVKMDQNKVVSLLKGPRGSEVTVGIERRPEIELLPFTIQRGAIPMKSLEASFMIGTDIGYVRFSRFAATTYQELMFALMDLVQSGARKFIMDLRGNTGGYLDQAIVIANEFLPQGEKIVYTEGYSSPKTIQTANGRGLFQSFPLAVVIDEISASASEIMAGAIQDNDRGVIVGRRSFGKGLVQEQFSYADSSAIRITVARYYTPVGRSIQKPYTPGKGEEYDRDLVQRMEHNEFLTADSIQQNDSLRYVTPKGKIVYGGGGIMPDIFVPFDTASYTNYYVRASNSQTIFRYATQFVEQHRQQINSITTLDELDAFFARRNLYYDFLAYAERQGLRANQTEMTLSKNLILAQVKGLIGRNTSLDETAYYYYMAEWDPTIHRTIEALRDEAGPVAESEE